MIRPARREELPRLVSLWRDCFGDSEDEIDRCIRSFCPPGQALVLEEGGKICSMLLRLPMEIVLADGTAYGADYVYAFCTDPAERNKGYGKRLLAAEEALCGSNGSAAVLLVPGEPGLFRFYGALGYEPTLLRREERFFASGGGGMAVTSCTPERYGRERERWLAGRNHIRYGPEQLIYQEASCRLAGGGLYALEDGAAAAAVTGETLLVQELLTHRPGAAVTALLAALGCREAIVYTPVPAGGGGRPFGMVKWLDASPAAWGSGWLAFAFE